MIYVLFSIFILVSSPSLAAEVSLEVKKDKTNAYEQASASSNVVASFPKGELLQGVSRKGMFWQVELSASKQKAYVKALDVRKKLSEQRIQALTSNQVDDSVDGSRARTAVMGVRGLDSSDTLSGASMAVPDMDRIRDLDRLQVSPDRLIDLELRIQREVEMRMSE